MRASELIKVLQMLIATCGDRVVYSGGEDYPGEVRGVHYVKVGDGYIPTGSFSIYGGI